MVKLNKGEPMIMKKTQDVSYQWNHFEYYQKNGEILKRYYFVYTLKFISKICNRTSNQNTRMNLIDRVKNQKVITRILAYIDEHKRKSLTYKKKNTYPLNIGIGQAVCTNMK